MVFDIATPLEKYRQSIAALAALAGDIDQQAVTPRSVRRSQVA